jgi:DNA-binding response OmpR family regulator
VTACQGTLTVFAAAEGLTIELPPGIGLAAAPDAGLAPASIAEQRQASVGETTILVVDDEPDIVRLLRDTLAPEGYRLLSADNGEVALHLARHERPSLILLDWRMPGQDGLDVCRSLRNDPDPALRRIPVVLLTAQTGDVNIAAGFSAGATDYLTKPFRPAHVRSRVRGWLLRSRQEPEGGGTAPTEIP